MFYIRDWFNSKRSEKTGDWASRCIKMIRMNMLPLISFDEAELGMSYLLATQSMDYVKILFQNTTKINLTNEKKLFNHLGNPINRHDGHDEFMNNEMSPVNFRGLPILEKHLRINIAEMKKMGPILDVRSNDPTSTEQRKRDENILKNRKKMERDLSDIYTKSGQPPVKMDHYESRFEEKVGNGNIEAFDAMGLDDGDPKDINQFMQHFHKLIQEMAAQDVIDYCMTDNQIVDRIDMWVTDCWAKKAMCAACHVSDINGRITYDYLVPETVYIYGGSRNKGYNDANAKAYQQKVSIKEMLDRFGNAFDFEAEWDKLLMAITFANDSVEFTGVKPSVRGFFSGTEQLTTKGGTAIGYDNFLAFKVTIGYVEWTSQNQDVFGNVDKEDGKQLYQNNQNPDGERYQTKARYETPTYKSFYLAVSSIDQILFNFGEMTYQQIEGYNDYSVNFSIVTWKEIGEPLAIMARPFIDIINECWYKFKYEIRRAKPRGMSYNYDSLIAIAEDVFSDTELTKDGKLQKLLSFYDSSANTIWTYPKDEMGRMITQNISQLNIDQPNGPSPEIKTYWEIIINNLDTLQEMLTGKAPLRQGDPGGSRDSMNNQFKALEYSQNATYYIPDMLTYLFQQLASKTMLFVQDIIQYKNHNTLAYNYLLHAVGEDALQNINGLGKRAMHRYGIFIESLNQTVKREKLSARIDFALQNGKITNAQALLVEEIKNPIKAFMWLSYFEEKTEKAKNDAAQQQQMLIQKGQQEQDKRLFALEKMKIDGKLQDTTLQGQFEAQRHANTDKAGIVKTEMKLSAEGKEIYAQLHADIMKLMAEQGTLPSGIPAPPQGAPAIAPNGPPHSPERPESGISTLINQSQPLNTQAAPQ